MDRLKQNYAANAEEGAAAAEELSSEDSLLNEMLDHFKLRGIHGSEKENILAMSSNFRMPYTDNTISLV